MAAKTLKYSVSLTDKEVQTFPEGKENHTLKEKPKVSYSSYSKPSSGFYISLALYAIYLFIYLLQELFWLVGSCFSFSLLEKKN